MIDYRAGVWGFHVAFGVKGSLAPRALVMALPNAVLTLIFATWAQSGSHDWYNSETAKHARAVLAIADAIMIFILYNRSRTSYNRWWEGGTLLQKTRGEWFNAYSSIMAFTSTKPEMQDQVDAYVHFLARMMSLLMCCGLQQVSPSRSRPFEILDLEGINPVDMEFLNTAPDKVEIILQWIQRSIVIHQATGVLPAAPPILSRAFQEVSRGIVNLQNARKIADFPYPYPLAQISMMLQMLHWMATPIVATLAMPAGFAVPFSFLSIFVLWCIHFNALDLEFPFGSKENDLPMDEFMQDWNNSICTLLARRATRPPGFKYNPKLHNKLSIAMSDASKLYRAGNPKKFKDRQMALIQFAQTENKRPAVTYSASRSVMISSLEGEEASDGEEDYRDKFDPLVNPSQPSGTRMFGELPLTRLSRYSDGDERTGRPSTVATTDIFPSRPSTHSSAEVTSQEPGRSQESTIVGREVAAETLVPSSQHVIARHRASESHISLATSEATVLGSEQKHVVILGGEVSDTSGSSKAFPNQRPDDFGTGGGSHEANSHLNELPPINLPVHDRKLIDRKVSFENSNPESRDMMLL